MSEQKKRYVGVKKSSLEGLSEEWGPECYAYVTPANYDDNLAFGELDTKGKSQRDQVDMQLKFVREHFISGKIKVFDGEEFVLTDMTIEDATSTVGIADKLFADIIGFDLDPKDLRKVAMENTLPTASESSTGTQ